MRKTRIPGYPGWEQYPETCAVYALYEGARCLYVGSSVNLRQRLRFHPLRTRISSIWFIECFRAELEQREQEHMDRLRPTLNKHRVAKNRCPTREERSYGVERPKVAPSGRVNLKLRHRSWKRTVKPLYPQTHAVSEPEILYPADYMPQAQPAGEATA